MLNQKLKNNPGSGAPSRRQYFFLPDLRELLAPLRCRVVRFVGGRKIMESTGFRFISFAILLAGFLGFLLLGPQVEARGRYGGGNLARGSARVGASGVRAGGAAGYRGGGYAGRTFHGGSASVNRSYSGSVSRYNGSVNRNVNTNVNRSLNGHWNGYYRPGWGAAGVAAGAAAGSAAAPSTVLCYRNGVPSYCPAP